MLRAVPEPTPDREMPSDVGVEQFLIGSVLMDNRLYARIGDVVEDEHFNEPFHRKIWETVRQLIERGKIASVLTIQRFLGQEEISGQSVKKYLARLAAEGGGPPASMVEHAHILRDLYVRRRLISLAMDLSDQCFNADVGFPVSSILDMHEEEMTSLRPKITPARREFITFDDAAIDAVRAASDAFSHNEAVIGLPTGLHNLDSGIGGLQKSDLVVVAGRPGMGKTALATNIAFNVARHLVEKARTGIVAFFSLEMSSQQLATRILAEQSHVEGWRIRRGKVSAGEVEEFIQGAEALRGLPLIVDDRPRQTLGYMMASARRLHKRSGIALMIVDYLQLMRGSDKRESNRTQEVTEITGGLKGLAKELECPVLALSQLSRNIESREDKRPQLADLRESGSIEQDADAVLMIYRESYYLERAEPRQGTDAHFQWEVAMEAAHGRAEVIVAKNRHGPLVSVPLGWNAKLTRFHNDVPDKPETAPKEPRVKADKPAYSKDATHCYGVLKGMALQGLVPTKDQCAADSRLDPHARLLPVDAARTNYGKQYGGGIDEKRLKTEFTKVCKELYQNGKLKWTGSEAARYIWLPESVRKP